MKPELRRTLTRAAVRLEVVRALEALPLSVGPFLPPLAGGVVGLVWLGHGEVARTVLSLGLLLLLGRLLRKLGPRITSLAAATELDRRRTGAASFAVALAFSELSEVELGPFHRLAIQEASRDVPKLRLASVFPVRLSSALVADSVNLVLVVALFFAKSPGEVTASASPQLPSPQMSSDLKRVVERSIVEVPVESEPALAIQADARALRQALSQDAIRPEAALLAIGELEEAVQRERRGAAELEERMVRRGQALSKSSLTRQAGSALSKGDFAEAQQSLRQLADRLAQGADPLSVAELEKLRSAVMAAIDKRSKPDPGAAQSASQHVEPNARAEGTPAGKGSQHLAARAKELSDKALRGSLSPEETQELQALERRLASLERRSREAARAEQAESLLDQQLNEAARALAEAQKKGGAERTREAAKYVQGAAEALGGLAPKVLTDDEKRELLRELERQKARVQNGGPDGEAARAELREFERRARGEGGGAKQLSAEGAGELEAMASGASRLDPSAGSNHDPQVLGTEARLREAKAFETVAAYARSQQGPTEAEVVRRAARTGFLDPTYRQMYLEYEKEDEAVLARDRVPEGYRARVLRYFELIGPSGASR